MKTLVILSENAKGLFTDKEHMNDLSTEVKKAFENGEEKVTVKAGEKTLILTGYLNRGATSADSAFTYISGEKKYICKELRKYFGLPLYTKKHKEQKETETFLTMFEKLKKYEPTENELNSIIEYYKSIEKGRKNKKRIGEISEEITEKEKEIKTLQKHGVAKTIIEKIAEEIKKLNVELKELTK